MRALLDNKFAPITSSIGFLETSLPVAAERLHQWRQHLYGSGVVSSELDGLDEGLASLEPLVTGHTPRELLVEHGSWSAYFDCSLFGTDAAPVVSYLARELACRGVAIDVTPHSLDRLRGVGRPGAVKWELFGPNQTDFLNYIRTVALVHNGRKWEFEAHGQVQAYEDVERYRRLKTSERFGPDLVEAYCADLGLNIFDTNSYGPACVLIKNPSPVPQGAREMTLAEARAWMQIST